MYWFSETKYNRTKIVLTIARTKLKPEIKLKRNFSPLRSINLLTRKVVLKAIQRGNRDASEKKCKYDLVIAYHARSVRAYNGLLKIAIASTITPRHATE
jgi:hypothetical protein